MINGKLDTLQSIKERFEDFADPDYMYVVKQSEYFEDAKDYETIEATHFDNLAEAYQYMELSVDAKLFETDATNMDIRLVYRMNGILITLTGLTIVKPIDEIEARIEFLQHKLSIATPEYYNGIEYEIKILKKDKIDYTSKPSE